MVTGKVLPPKPRILCVEFKTCCEQIFKFILFINGLNIIAGC